MTETFYGIVCSDLLTAKTTIAEINTAKGFPCCNCPDCSGVPYVTGGIHPACLCKGTVNLNCPHITKTYAEPIQTQDGKS